MARICAQLFFVAFVTVPVGAEAQLLIIEDDETGEEVEEPMELWIGISGSVGNADFSGIDPSAVNLDDEIIGGASLTATVDYDDWLRVVDFRLNILGAAHDARATPLPGSSGTVRVRPLSTVIARAELGTGVYHRLGPIVPYALVRLAFGAASIERELDDQMLDMLTVDKPATLLVEAGLEAGLHLEVAEHMRLQAAYSVGLLGLPSHNVVFGFSARVL